MLWKTYRVAKTAEEALEALKVHSGGAGADRRRRTDLIPRLKGREMSVECLVDITRIEDLSKIEGEGDWTNALYHATGVRIFDLPLTPERVLRGLKNREKGVK